MFGQKYEDCKCCWSLSIVINVVIFDIKIENWVKVKSIENLHFLFFA